MSDGSGQKLYAVFELFFCSKNLYRLIQCLFVFISNSIMLASALHYLAQQNVAGDLCFKFTILFMYVCQ